MDWILILAILSGIGTVFSVAALWQRIYREQKEKAWPMILAVLVAVLAGVSVYLASVNRELAATRSEARRLLATWPNESFRDGDISIVHGALAFLEKHRDTYSSSLDRIAALAEDFRRECDFSREDYSDVGCDFAAEKAASAARGAIAAIAED